MDGQGYNLLGELGTATSIDAVQSSFYFSPTRSSFLFQAGGVNVNMTFVTSIEVRGGVSEIDRRAGLSSRACAL